MVDRYTCIQTDYVASKHGALLLLLVFFRYIFRNAKKVGMQELGPRFTLKLRSLQKGTFDSKYGDYIWTHNVNLVNIIIMYLQS